jgi:hypothetical protein
MQNPNLALPLVVQIGFAGPRDLLDPKEYPGIDPDRFEAELQRQLTEWLKRLRQELTLGPRFFLCGISQIAIGGDTVFTRACRDAGMIQRIFLPQPRDEYVNAIGSAGPDFTDQQKTTALELLHSPHVVQERVVSSARDRHDRFHDVNLEIVQVSDLLVCLSTGAHSSRRGGTGEVIELAARRRRPVLELRLEIDAGGVPTLKPQWHHREEFVPPTLPLAIASATLPPGTQANPLPSADDYARGLKDLTSQSANWERQLFKLAAFVIIVAHVLATIFAVLALKMHGEGIQRLLMVELVLLAAGFGVHQFLHHTHRVERWAVCRLAAEVARSVSAIGQFHVYLGHLFSLPFPNALRPLLRTISALHLRSTVAVDRDDWCTRRDAYVQKRLVDRALQAQIPYNVDTRDRASAALTLAKRVFVSASLSAIAATALKLLVSGHYLHLENTIAETATAVLGALAIILPVIAVAALSLASAFDLEARFHTSEEMVAFLEKQKTLLENASSAREFSRLLIEAESRLLGETANWYARRSFLGVA